MNAHVQLTSELAGQRAVRQGAVKLSADQLSGVLTLQTQLHHWLDVCSGEVHQVADRWVQSSVPLQEAIACCGGKGGDVCSHPSSWVQEQVLEVLALQQRLLDMYYDLCALRETVAPS